MFEEQYNKLVRSERNCKTIHQFFFISRQRILLYCHFRLETVFLFGLRKLEEI